MKQKENLKLKKFCIKYAVKVCKNGIELESTSRKLYSWIRDNIDFARDVVPYKIDSESSVNSPFVKQAD